jgi:hypothetical protein
MLCSNTFTQNTNGVPASCCPYSRVVQAPDYILHQYGCMVTADDMDSCLCWRAPCCSALPGAAAELLPSTSLLYHAAAS